MHLSILTMPLLNVHVAISLTVYRGHLGLRRKKSRKAFLGPRGAQKVRVKKLEKCFTFDSYLALPQNGAIPPMVFSSTQAHLCDTPCCNISRQVRDTPYNQARKSFAILSLQVLCDMESVVVGPLNLRWEVDRSLLLEMHHSIVFSWRDCLSPSSAFSVWLPPWRWISEELFSNHWKQIYHSGAWQRTFVHMPFAAAICRNNVRAAHSCCKAQVRSQTIESALRRLVDVQCRLSIPFKNRSAWARCLRCIVWAHRASYAIRTWSLGAFSERSST